MFAFLPGKLLWIGVALAHCQKTVNAAVNHAVYGSNGIKGHMLGVDYVGELTQIGHLSVGNDICAKILMDDAFLLLDTVKSQGTDLAIFDIVDQCVDIHQGPSGTVDQNHAVLHLMDSLIVDHMPGIRRQRHMEGDDVAFRIKLIQGYIFRKIGNSLGRVGIVS